MAAFTFVSIDSPDARAPGTTSLTKVNEAGVFTGNTNVSNTPGGERAFVDDHGNFILLQPEEGGPTSVGDINNNSQVVGSMHPPGFNRAFVADPDNGVQNYRAPDAASTGATGTNDAGQVIGTYYQNGLPDPFYTDPDGTYHNLVVPGAKTASPFDINNTGVIVGSYTGADGKTHGMYDDHGNFSSLDVAGATSTVIDGINDRGELVGSYKDAAGATHGFFRGVMGRVATMDVPGGTNTSVNGIDNSDDLVGNYTDTGGLTHGFAASRSLGQLVSIGGDQSLAKDLTPAMIGVTPLVPITAPAGSAATATAAINPTVVAPPPT